VSEIQALTELQLALLQVLWDRGEATTQQIHEALLPDRGLALTTIATLLSRLEKREILTHRKEGRQYVYRPLVTRAQVRRSKVRELTETLFQGDPAELLQHLVRSSETGPEELDRLRRAIAEAEAAGDG